MENTEKSTDLTNLNPAEIISSTATLASAIAPLTQSISQAYTAYTTSKANIYENQVKLKISQLENATKNKYLDIEFNKFLCKHERYSKDVERLFNDPATTPEIKYALVMAELQQFYNNNNIQLEIGE